MPRIFRFAYLRPRKSVIEPTIALRFVKIFMASDTRGIAERKLGATFRFPGQL